jgi:hypothetical protein
VVNSKEFIMAKTETGAAEAPRHPSPDLEALIERWWQEHFPGSPVAQVTGAWNHAFAAKEELKRRLANFTGA